MKTLLRFLYTLQITFLSFCVLNLQLAPTALAKTTAEREAEMKEKQKETEDKEKEAKEDGDISEEDQNAVAEATGSGTGSGSGADELINYEEEGIDPDNLEGMFANSFWLELAIMIAAIVASIGYFVGCTSIPSAWIFAIGGLIYLIVEIINWANYDNQQEISKTKIEAKKKQNAEEYAATQEAVQAAIADLEAAKSAGDTRYIMTIIATVLWFVAAIVALIEGILRVWGFNDACTGEYNPQKMPGLIANNDKSPIDLRKLIPGEKVEKTFAFEVKRQLHAEDVAYHMDRERWFHGEKQSLDLNTYNSIKNDPSLSGGPKIKTDTGPMKKIQSLLASIMFPEAYAGSTEDWLTGIGFVGIFVALILGIISIATGVQSSARANGFVRCAIFAIFGALGIFSTVILKNRLDAIDERIDKFNKLLKDISVTMESPTTGDMTGNTDISDGSTGAPPSGEITENQLGGACAQVSSTDPSGGAKLDPTCSCAPNCGSIDKVIDQSAFEKANASIPSFALDSFNTAKTGVNEVSNGKGLSKDLKNLGSKESLAKAKKLFKDGTKKLLARYKKEGVKHPGLVEAMKKYADKLNQGVKSEFAKFNKKDQERLINAFGKDGQGQTNPSDEKDPNEEYFRQMLAKQKSQNTGDNKAKPLTISLDDEKAKTESSEEVDSATALGKYEEAYKFKAGDIYTDSGIPIWQIISSRYRKTAYPVIFSDKKKEKQETKK